MSPTTPGCRPCRSSSPRDNGEGAEIVFSTTDVTDVAGTFNFDDLGIGVYEIVVTATDGDADWADDGATATAGRTAVVGEIFVSTTTRAKLEVEGEEWVTLHRGDMTSVASGSQLFDHAMLSHPWFSWWSPNLDAFHMLEDGSMLLSTDGHGEIGDVGFRDGGLVRFYGDKWLERNPTDPGSHYQTAQMVATERQIFGTRRCSADIDAISMAPSGDIVISLAHDRTLADGQSYESGDLIQLSLYEDGTLAQSSLLFDGDVLNATGRGRWGSRWCNQDVNVNGAHVLEDGRIVLTVSGTARVGDDGARFEDGDLFVYDPASNTAELLFAEDSFRRNEDVDAVFIGIGNGEIDFLQMEE